MGARVGTSWPARWRWMKPLREQIFHITETQAEAG